MKVDKELAATIWLSHGRLIVGVIICTVGLQTVIKGAMCSGMLAVSDEMYGASPEEYKKVFKK